MLLGGRHDTEPRSSRAKIPRTMMAAVAYATEFGAATRSTSESKEITKSNEKSNEKKSNEKSNEKRKRIQKTESKTRIPPKMRKGIEFLAAVASTKPKYGGLRITGTAPFVEFRQGNQELFSKRVLQRIKHYTNINIGVSEYTKVSGLVTKTKSSLGSKRTDDVLRATMGEGKYEHERYKTRSDDEQYGDDETARLCLFFLCELAFNEAKFITKGVELNMIEGRDITGVIKDLLQAASVGFKKLDKDLTYDSMTKREQDLYCAICLMAKKAGLWTQDMSNSSEAKLSDNHALLKKLTELGFDSQLSSRTQDSQEENAGGMFNATGVNNIINRLKTTKYEHTKAIVENIVAEKAETGTPVIDDSISSAGNGTSHVSSITNNGAKSPKRKGDQSQSDIKGNDKGLGARNTDDNNGASMSKENDGIPDSAGEEGGSKKTRAVTTDATSGKSDNSQLNKGTDDKTEDAEQDPGEGEEAKIEVFGIKEDAVGVLVSKITNGKSSYTFNEGEYHAADDKALLAIVGLINENASEKIDSYLKWQNGSDKRLVVFVCTEDCEKIKTKATDMSNQLNINLYISNPKATNIQLYCFGTKPPVHELLHKNGRWNEYVGDSDPEDQTGEGVNPDHVQEESVAGQIGQKASKKTEDSSWIETAKSDLFGADFQLEYNTAHGAIAHGTHDGKIVLFVGSADATPKTEQFYLVFKDLTLAVIDKINKMCKGSSRKALIKRRKEYAAFYITAIGDGTIVEDFSPVTKASLVSNETGFTMQLINQKTQDEKKALLDVTIGNPSVETALIRKSGIQAAVDYVSMVYNDNKGRISMCYNENPTEKQISPIQELVYLTLVHDADYIEKNKFLRIYAFAPGSGKTRAMGLALLESIRQFGIPADKNTNSYGLVVRKDLKFTQLIQEMLVTVTEADKEPRKILDVSSTIAGEHMKIERIVETVNGISKKGSDQLQHIKALMESTVKTIEEKLKDKGVFVLNIEDIDANNETQINDLRKCKIIVTDECHHLFPHIKELELFNCKCIYGFSATPIEEKETIDTLYRWLNDGKDPGGQNEEELQTQRERTIAENMCMVSGDDARLILPYADLKYEIHVLSEHTGNEYKQSVTDKAAIEEEKTATVSVNVLELEKATVEEEDHGKKQRPATFVKSIVVDNKVDHAEGMENEDLERVITDVITRLENDREGRAFVYAQTQGILDMFIKLCQTRTDPLTFAYTAQDGMKDRRGKMFVDTNDGQSNIMRHVFNNTIPDAGGDSLKHIGMAGVITTQKESLEYHGIPNTYIIGTPDPEECEQARNRAFRMCSHYKTSYDEQTHTIHHYVVRKEGGLHRGAYALASAYPSTGNKRDDYLLTVLSAAQRLKIATKKIQRVQGTIANDQTSKKREAKTKIKKSQKKVSKGEKGADKAKYQPNNENGAYTVDNLVEFWNSTDNGNLRVVTHDERTARLLNEHGINTSDAARDPIEFDTSKYHMIQFHHTLRGIRFTRSTVSGGPISHDNTEKTKVVHLNYRDAKQPVLGSIDVYDNVDTAYYDGAHRIQCRGQLRFECYRVKGTNVKRVFVGTQAEYDWFISMLVGGRECPKGDTSDEKVTPMMLEMLVRRNLLIAGTVHVEFGASHKDLSEYISAAMSEWGQSYTGENTNPGGDKCITVYTSYDASKKKTVKKITENDLVEIPRFYAHKAIQSLRPGTLLVFASEEHYKGDATEQINVNARVLDIRGRKACKSMLNDKCAVRCAIAIFVGVNDSNFSWFDVTRVAADEYYKCASVSELRTLPQGTNSRAPKKVEARV